MKGLFISLIAFLLPLKSNAQVWANWDLTATDTAKVFGLDLIIQGEGYQFRFFPAGQFVHVSTPAKSMFISSRGAGFSFQEGNWSLFSVFYDTQISGLKGMTGDSTLSGLNYVRFKGTGNDQFSKGPADQVDFDEAHAFARYDFSKGFVLFGKYPFISGPSTRNNLLFSGSTGDFPHLYFNIERSVFKYEFLYGFLKHFKSANSLSNKSVVWHQASFHWPQWLRIYAWEAVFLKGHRVLPEYMNPLLFLRSADHYNFSPDNATMGAGTEIFLTPFRIYQEFLIDDLETGKLGSGWFRNKTAGLTGVEHHFLGTGYESTLTAEVVWAMPFTYSHRTPEINMTHYGSQLGPELGPNSIKTGLYGEFMLTGPKIRVGIFLENWQAGVTEPGHKNVGDDVHTGHPEPPGNPGYEDYITLLDGKRESTVLISGYLSKQWIGINFWVRPSYFTADFSSPGLQLRKGFYFEGGLRYELSYFDLVRPEFW